MGAEWLQQVKDVGSLQDLRIEIKVIQSILDDDVREPLRISPFSLQAISDDRMWDRVFAPLLDNGDVDTVEWLVKRFNLDSCPQVDLVRCAKSLGEDAESVAKVEAFLAVSLPRDDSVGLLKLLSERCGSRGGKLFCENLLFEVRLSTVLDVSVADFSTKDPTVLLRMLLGRLADPSGVDILPLIPQFVQRYCLQDSRSVATTKQAVTTAMVDVFASELHKASVKWTIDEFHMFSMICDDPRLLGDKLMESLHKKGNSLHSYIQAEILVRAHNSYILAIHSEGVAFVMDVIKKRIDKFAEAGDFAQLVHILLGTREYFELRSIMDVLLRENAFELLLKRDPRMDEFERLRLMRILQAYMDEKQVPDKLFQLFYICFKMYREMGDLCLAKAEGRLMEMSPEKRATLSTPRFRHELAVILQLLVDSSSYYQKERSLQNAHKALTIASLVSLQCEYLETKLINLTHHEARRAMVTRQSLSEARVVCMAYNLDKRSEWHRALYQQVIVQSNFPYLEEYLGSMPVKPSLWIDLAARYRNDAHRAERQRSFLKFLKYLDDIFLRYYLANEFGFKDFAASIAPPDTLYQRWIRQNQESLLKPK